MNFLVRAIQRGAERKLRVPADYLGRIGETSFSGLFKFLLVLPAAGHGRRATRDIVNAARIVAAQHEDCGTCVQIAVNTALDQGMPAELARAILDRQTAELSPEVLLSVDFAEAVLTRAPTADDLRSRVEAQLGAKTLTAISLAIATGRIFPTLKRALGFATSCSAVQIEV